MEDSRRNPSHPVEEGEVAESSPKRPSKFSASEKPATQNYSWSASNLERPSEIAPTTGEIRTKRSRFEPDGRGWSGSNQPYHPPSVASPFNQSSPPTFGGTSSASYSRPTPPHSVGSTQPSSSGFGGRPSLSLDGRPLALPPNATQFESSRLERVHSGYDRPMTSDYRPREGSNGDYRDRDSGRDTRRDPYREYSNSRDHYRESYNSSSHIQSRSGSGGNLGRADSSQHFSSALAHQRGHHDANVRIAPPPPQPPAMQRSYSTESHYVNRSSSEQAPHKFSGLSTSSPPHNPIRATVINDTTSTTQKLSTSVMSGPVSGPVTTVAAVAALIGSQSSAPASLGSGPDNSLLGPSLVSSMSSGLTATPLSRQISKPFSPENDPTPSARDTKHVLSPHIKGVDLGSKFPVRRGSSDSTPVTPYIRSSSLFDLAGGGKANVSAISADDVLPEVLGDLSTTSSFSKSTVATPSLIHPDNISGSQSTDVIATTPNGMSGSSAVAVAHDGMASAKRARVAWGQGLVRRVSRSESIELSTTKVDSEPDAGHSVVRTSSNDSTEASVKSLELPSSVIEEAANSIDSNCLPNPTVSDISIPSVNTKKMEFSDVQVDSGSRDVVDNHAIDQQFISAEPDSTLEMQNPSELVPHGENIELSKPESQDIEIQHLSVPESPVPPSPVVIKPMIVASTDAPPVVPQRKKPGPKPKNPLEKQQILLERAAAAAAAAANASPIDPPQRKKPGPKPKNLQLIVAGSIVARGEVPSKLLPVGGVNDAPGAMHQVGEEPNKKKPRGAKPLTQKTIGLGSEADIPGGTIDDGNHPSFASPNRIVSMENGSSDQTHKIYSDSGESLVDGGNSAVATVSKNHADQLTPNIVCPGTPSRLDSKLHVPGVVDGRAQVFRGRGPGRGGRGRGGGRASRDGSDARRDDGQGITSIQSQGGAGASDRVSINQVFSHPWDRLQAAAAVKSMFILRNHAMSRRGNASDSTPSFQLSTNILPGTAEKYPFPTSSDITLCLGAIEDNGYDLQDSLITIQRGNLKLAEILAYLEAQPDDPRALPVYLQANSGTLSLQLLKEYETEQVKKLAMRELINLESPTLGPVTSVHHHNNKRIIEAALFSNIVEIGGHIDESTLLEQSYGTTKLASMEEQMKRTSQELLAKRADITQEIRRRKLATKQAWRALSNQHLGVNYLWKKHVEATEREDESNDREGPRLRPNNSQQNIQSRPVVPDSANRSSSRLSSSSSLGVGGGTLAPTAGSNSFSSTPFSSPVLGSSRRDNSELIRSEYTQERLLQQLEIAESFKLRIKHGAAGTVDMISPWLRADGYRSPPEPSWPSAVREFMTAKKRRRQTTEGNDDSTANIAAGPTLVLPAFDPVPPAVHEPAKYVDSAGSRLTTDGKTQHCSLLAASVACPVPCNCARQVDLRSRRQRVWSDMEKAIFIDKFLQFPKNFNKIASFLANRSTKDCVKFYYDSKTKIPYKQLLREFDSRKRNLKTSWSQSIEAASSVGARLFSPTDPDVKEPLAELPVDDSTYHSYLNHPPFLAEAFGVNEPRSRARKLIGVPRLLTSLQMKRREDISREDDSDSDEDNFAIRSPLELATGLPTLGHGWTVPGDRNLVSSNQPLSPLTDSRRVTSIPAVTPGSRRGAAIASISNPNAPISSDGIATTVTRVPGMVGRPPKHPKAPRRPYGSAKRELSEDSERQKTPRRPRLIGERGDEAVSRPTRKKRLGATDESRAVTPSDAVVVDNTSLMPTTESNVIVESSGLAQEAENDSVALRDDAVMELDEGPVQDQNTPSRNNESEIDSGDDGTELDADENDDAVSEVANDVEAPTLEEVSDDELESEGENQMDDGEFIDNGYDSSSPEPEQRYDDDPDANDDGYGGKDEDGFDGDKPNDLGSVPLDELQPDGENGKKDFVEPTDP